METQQSKGNKMPKKICVNKENVLNEKPKYGNDKISTTSTTGALPKRKYSQSSLKEDKPKSKLPREALSDLNENKRVSQSPSTSTAPLNKPVRKSTRLKPQDFNTRPVRKSTTLKTQDFNNKPDNTKIETPIDSSTTVKKSEDVSKLANNLLHVKCNLQLENDEKVSRNLRRETTFVISDNENEMFYTAREDNSWINESPNKQYQEHFKCPVSSNGCFMFKIYDGIPSLKKKTLLFNPFSKHLVQPSNYEGIVNLDPNTPIVKPFLLYTLDYFYDNIQYFIKKQRKFIVDPFAIITNKRFYMEYREELVNWIAKLHQYQASDEGVLFICIRILENFINTIDVCPHELQLAAMACYWIACKFGDIFAAPTASSLLKLCNNEFSKESLKDAERKILKQLKFEISVCEPTYFVKYYIYLLKLEDSNKISLYANYLLECLLLCEECNMFLLSLQAAGATVLALKFLNIDLKRWKLLTNRIGYHSIEEMAPVHYKIINKLQLMKNSDYPYKTTFQKYSTQKFGSVSLDIAMSLTSHKQIFL